MSVIVRGTAEKDMLDTVDYISRNNIDAATRFEDDAYATFARLEANPGLGVIFRPENPNLPGLRVWRFLTFGKYAVFYLTIPDGVEIVRVLHQARDAAAIIAAEE